jgi:hypothetical protein
MAETLHINDWPSELIFDCVNDISSATGYGIRYKKPDGTTGEWIGTRNGTSIEYTTVDGDIDQTGNWRFWSFITLTGGGKIHGNLYVKDVLPIE